MGSCSTLGCKNRTINVPKGVTFHRFPSDPEQRAKWIAATGRSGWKPTSNSCICSVHFKDEDLNRTSLCTVRVREGCVPSLNCPASRESTSRKRKNVSCGKNADPAVPENGNTAARDAAGIKIVSSYSLAPSGRETAQNPPGTSLAHPEGNTVDRTQNATKMWSTSRLQSILKKVVVRKDTNSCDKTNSDTASDTTLKDNGTQLIKRRRVEENVQFPAEHDVFQPSGAEGCGASAEAIEGSTKSSAVQADEEVDTSRDDKPQLLCTETGSAVPLHLIDHAALCRKTASTVVRHTSKPTTADVRSRAFLQSLPQILPKPLPSSSSVSLQSSVTSSAEESLQQPLSQTSHDTSPQTAAQAFLHTLCKSLPQTTSTPVLPPSEQRSLLRTIERSSHEHRTEELPQALPESLLRHVSQPVQQAVPQTLIVLNDSSVDTHNVFPEASSVIVTRGIPLLEAVQEETDMEPTCNHFDEILELKSQIQQFRNLYLKVKKQNKALGQSVRWYKARKERLKKTISELKRCPQMVDHTESLEGDAKAGAELLKRYQVKLNGDVVPTEYTPELRTFATTLHAYSCRAYDYVRKVFSDCLPHVSTVQKWNRPNKEAEITSVDMSVIERVVSEGCNDIENEGTAFPIIVLRNSDTVADEVQVEVMQLLGEVV